MCSRPCVVVTETCIYMYIYIYRSTRASWESMVDDHGAMRCKFPKENNKGVFFERPHSHATFAEPCGAVVLREVVQRRVRLPVGLQAAKAEPPPPQRAVCQRCWRAESPVRREPRPGPHPDEFPCGHKSVHTCLTSKGEPSIDGIGFIMPTPTHHHHPPACMIYTPRGV